MSLKDKAIKLHQDNPVIDAHLDLGMDILYRHMAGEKEVFKRYYLDDFKRSGVNIIAAAIYVDELYPEVYLRTALDQISAIMDDIKTCDGEVILVKTKDQLHQVIEENKTGIILSLEGLDPIINDIRLLNIFYELGVRGAGLVWSRRNFIADGCYFKPVEEDGRRGGLTRFGIDIVKKLEEMGFFIDVSHLNDEGVEDVFRFTEKPLIASHSNARAVFDMYRNLPDRHIQGIAERGGVIGINALAIMAGAKYAEDKIGKLCDHVDHIVKLTGIRNVGYGFDLCDAINDSVPQFKSKMETTHDDIIANHYESVRITEELLRRGYSEEDVKLIIGGNFLRYYEEMLPDNI